MTDELELLRRLGTRLDREGGLAEDRARQALDRAVAREARGRKRPSSRRRAYRVSRIAVVMAITALAFLIANALRSGSTAGPPVAAAAVLEKLARAAASQPTVVPASGQYLYTASRSLTSADTGLPGGVTCEVVFSEARQNWIATNGEGLFREQDGRGHLAAGEPARCRSLLTQGEFSAQTSDTWAAPGCLSIDPVPLGKLPRRPSTLRARLLTGKVEGGPPGPLEAFTQVGDLLRETDAPPALRAALYRAAAGLAGVRNLGKTTDKLGRHGVALAIDSNGIRHELIFSTQTASLLAQQDILIGPSKGIHATVGTVLDWSSFLPSHVVDRLPSPSPLPLRPECIKGGATGLDVPGNPHETVLVGSSFLKQSGR